MQPFSHILFLAALAVAMVTSAPLTNQERLVNVEQTGKTIDRAKRAQEEIVFGNQQNKARVVSKKSVVSDILEPQAPQGERDQGAVVIAHKGLPVHEDLAARAEAAGGSENQHKEVIKEAVEAAIQTVAEAEKVEAEKVEAEKVATERVEAELGAKEANDVSHSDAKITTQVVNEIGEGEHGTGLASELVEQKVEEQNSEEDNLKNFEEGAVGNVRFEGGSDGDDSKDDDVEKFLQEKQDVDESKLDRDRDAFFYENGMRNYLMSLAAKQNLPFTTRFRRSLHRLKASLSPKKSHRGRRIKRDLLDDTYYTPYEPQSSYITPEDIKEALLGPDEESQLSDEESDYINQKLQDYIADNYVPEEEEEEEDDSDQGESPLDAYLNGYEEPVNEPYTPYDIYSDDNTPYLSSSYDNKYPYGPIDFESYQNYVKRSMRDYFPLEEEKRYFFPFSKEPETHWGAFVPEKRDYGEAIQRLQRLAMALSDNPGPYYREMIEEYRKK